MKYVRILGYLVLMILAVSSVLSWKTPPPIPIGIYGFVSEGVEGLEVDVVSASRIIASGVSGEFGFVELQLGWNDPDTTEDEGLEPSGETISFKVDGYKVVLPKSLYLDVRQAGKFIFINITVKKSSGGSGSSGGSTSGGSGDSSIIEVPEKNVDESIDEGHYDSLNETDELVSEVPSMDDSNHSIPVNRTLKDYINMSEDERLEVIEEISDSMPIFPLPTNESIQEKVIEYEILSDNRTLPFWEQPISYPVFTGAVVLLYVMLLIGLIFLFLKRRKKDEERF